MANRNRQRDAWVSAVQLASKFMGRNLPDEVVVFFAEGSEVYQVISLNFCSDPDMLSRRLWTRAYSIDEATQAAAFMSRCEFVIRDEPAMLGELHVRRCSVIDPTTLEDSRVGNRPFEVTYIQD